MGYNISLRESNFFLDKRDFDLALQSLKSYYETRFKRRFNQHQFLGNALESLSWHCSFDAKGNINKLSWWGEKSGDDYNILDSIAPYVKSGSYIEMFGEDGEIWRWIFKDGRCKEITPKIVWEE